MPKKITAWQCSFCSRYRINKGSVTRHENICFKNPDRKILEGQLAIFSTMPTDLIRSDSYGVPNSEWMEPKWSPPSELLSKYKWWPLDENGQLGIGYVFTNGKWCKIKGYEPPHFAPGFSWKNEKLPDDIVADC